MSLEQQLHSYGARVEELALDSDRLRSSDEDIDEGRRESRRPSPVGMRLVALSAAVLIAGVLTTALVVQTRADEPSLLRTGSTAVDPSGPPSGATPDGTAANQTSEPQQIETLGDAGITKSWGCRYGFFGTNDAHTAAVILRLDAPPPPGLSTVSLPDPAWHGRLDQGVDLLRVPCGDLDTASSAAPEESWPVVGGTLQINVPSNTTSSGCEPGTTPATATITDLIVLMPDGTTLTFPQFSLVNDHWGCSAG